MNKINTKDISVIPPGKYCYTCIEIPSEKNSFRGSIKACPYLELRKDKPSQSNGYCKYLELGDWMDNGTMLLWDCVKECNINTND